jgi:hypothetical protein
MDLEPTGSGGGFSVLDGGAIVMGSAIASVHLTRVTRADPTGPSWLLAAFVFAWISVTAAGPFFFLVRKFRRSSAFYPKIGDRLWALLGLPWISTAVLQSASGSGKAGDSPLFVTVLGVGLAIACMIAMSVLWTSWVVVSPDQAARVDAGPWTNRIGLILAISWPVQCGLGMVVLS